MKFGVRLKEDLEEVGWEHYYFQYIELKNIIFEISNLDDRDQDTAAGMMTEFHMILTSDFVKLTSFINTKIKALKYEYNHKILSKLKLIKSSLKEQNNENNVMKSKDFILHYHSPYLLVLSFVAAWIDNVHALLEFMSVNRVCLEKIFKKFKRRLKGDATTKKTVEVLDKFTKELEGIQKHFMQEYVIKANEVEMEILVTSSTSSKFLNEQCIEYKRQRKTARLNRTQQAKYGAYSYKINLRPNNFLELAFIFTLMTLATTYLITYIGCCQDGDPDCEKECTIATRGWFISATLDQYPEKSIGALGLTVGICALSVVLTLKHFIVSNNLSGKTNLIMHRASLLIGYTASFCALGVSAFSYSDSFLIHNCFAGSFFVLSTVHVLIESYLDVRYRLSGITALRVRRHVTVYLVLFLVLFLSTMIYLMTGCSKSNPCPNRLKIRLFCAICEIVTFVLLILWFATYTTALRSTSFNLTVHHFVPKERLALTKVVDSIDKFD